MPDQGKSIQEITFREIIRSTEKEKASQNKETALS